ncbi:MAG: membrane protein insertion efficiency factor YidD [Chlamydiota bacterium]|nr:membrane protein insertion efficiency factor YidD [Chlamydiota bacterium]
MKKIIISTTFLLLLPIIAYSDPWGRDADLVNETTWRYETIGGRVKTPLFGTFAETMIGFHQKIVSPADGPRSHFYPSSSQYTKEAMRKYGFFKGFILGCDRLMRENPEEWVYPTTTLPGGIVLKYDPVK